MGPVRWMAYRLEEYDGKEASRAVVRHTSPADDMRHACSVDRLPQLARAAATSHTVVHVGRLGDEDEHVDP